jgi:hypothetical protein
MRRRFTAAAALIVAGILSATPAAADVAQPNVVSANPVDYTPHILDGTVRGIAVVGDIAVVGGDFSAVTDAPGRIQYDRSYVFAYRIATGQILNFRPRLDGPVQAVAAGPNGTVYLGGVFKNVNGVAQRGITQVNLADAQRTTGFGASTGDGDVRTLAVSGSWLYAGGTFTKAGGASRTALARFNATTGVIDTGFDLKLSDPTAATKSKVEDVAISPDGQSAVAVGAISRAGTLSRAQVVMFSPASAQVSNWWTDAYTGPCRKGFDTYLRGVDFSPAGDYFVIVATGRLSGQQRMCDTAARFQTAGTGKHNPVWVNHTGGDSLYAVSITGAAVYVGGHQRWMDNPFGNESAGPGAISRPGIAALDVATGHALAWNPTKARGIGTRALVAVNGGLLVGSDTETLGHEYHARIGMFPPG